MTILQRLCITPNPISLESYRGYLLRLSESNFFRTPATLLKLAGMADDDIRLAEHPVEAISSISNKPPELLARFSYGESASEGQLAGHAIKKYYLQLQHPKVCIQCIKENGFIKAHWDLAHVFICDTHQSLLQENCGNCNKRLKWFRRGIGVCNCNSTIDQIVQISGPDSMVDLHRVISAVNEKRRLTDTESLVGMPFDHLSHLSLQTLMGVIQSLGARAIKLKLQKDTHVIKNNPRQETIEAARIFANWPNNFHDFLDMDGALAPSNVLSLFQRHNAIYSSLFKMSYSEHEVVFLLKELINYAKNNGLVVDKRLLEKVGIKDGNFNVQNISMLTRKLGITPSTFKSRIEKKEISVKQLVGGNRPIFQNPNSTIDGYIQNTHGSLLIRDAAKYLGLPVSVISELRKIGIIKARYKTFKLSGWAIQDLDEFKSAIMEGLIEGQPKNLKNFVTMRSVMRRKSITGKSGVLAAIFNKDVTGHKVSPNIEDILISKKEVSRFFQHDVQLDNEMVDINSAAAFLGCDREALNKTIANGLIDATQGTNTRFISKAAMQVFNESLIFSSVAASLFGMSAVKFRKLSKDHDLEYVKDALGRPFIPLLLRKDELEKKLKPGAKNSLN